MKLPIHNAAGAALLVGDRAGCAFLLVGREGVAC